jgi:hypothetical protein
MKTLPAAVAGAPVAEYRRSIDALDRAIVNLTARLNANEYELLVMIREFDERGGWLKWGLSSCPEWLHFRCDYSLSAAREKVRVAHALRDLREISSAFEKGILSYSKVRALTRVATPRNESALLEFALTTTAARVEERCRQIRNVQPQNVEDANRAHGRRSLTTWRDEARGTMMFAVEVPIEAGELIEQALANAMEGASTDGPEFAEDSWQAQRADALVCIARDYLTGGNNSHSTSTADHYQVVLHLDQSALASAEGRADLPLESMRRLTCEGSVIPITDGPNGEPLNVGRKQRTVSTAIKRALWARDKACSYPGCTHTRFVDAHHVVHWSRGGETSVDNTMLLCSAHHRLVHEGGYTIRKDHRGRWYFRRPDGRAVPTYGYRPEDMIDDDIDGASEDCPSAEGSAHRGGAFEVRESRGAYEIAPTRRSRPESREPALLRHTSGHHEALLRHERVLVQGMEGSVLPGEASGERDARFLQWPSADRRDQQHVLPDPEEERHSRMA